jgi:hypothetical protein
MSKTLNSSLSLILLLALAAVPAWAQFALRGAIDGIITDPAKAVMPGVVVTLKDLDRNQTSTATTNESGAYSFRNLNPGRYQVTIEHSGFKKLISGVVEVGNQQTVRLDLSLEIGEITQTVEVTGGAPLLQTEQANIGAIADRNLVESLPVKGRNFTAFASLAPNVSTSPRGNTNPWGGTWAAGAHHVVGGTDFQVGGGGDNGYYLNGVNINDNWMGYISYAPSMESINEVKLDVTNFSAEHGRDIASMLVSTRGGTNDFHGSVFDYLNNSAVNAWNPYTKMTIPAGESKPMYQRNQYGGTFGGPLRIPKIFNGKDKFFFFVNYEGMRENSAGSTAIYRVPTERERQGDFGEWLERYPGDPNFIVYNPLSTVIDAEGNSHRTPLPNNDMRSIPGLINANALAMLAMFPIPNGYVNPNDPNDLRNYRTWSSTLHQSWRFDSRFDYRISNNDNVYVNFSRSHGTDNKLGGLLPQYPGDVDDTSYVVTANYAHVFSPTLTNEFIFALGKGQMYNVGQGEQDFMRLTDTPRTKYFQNIGSGPDLGFYGVHIQDPFYIGAGEDEVFMASNPSLQFSDNLSWMRGKHSMKAGMNFFRKIEHDTDYWRYVNFDRTFSNAAFGGNYLGGSALADFLAGFPTSLRQRYNFTGGDTDLNFAMPYWGFYFEDKFQVTPRLTINMGLRYDLSIPTYSVNTNGGAVLDMSDPGWQLAIPGRAEGIPQHYIPADKNNFAPRLGIAYRVKENWVIRANYGIFYDTGFNTTVRDNLFYAMNSVPGYTGIDLTQFNSGKHQDLPFLTFDNIFPPSPSIEVGTYPISTGKGTGYFDYPWGGQLWDKQSNVTPYFEKYMLDVQKTIGVNTVISANYLGSRGVKQASWENFNSPPYQTGWSDQTVYDAARPNTTGRWTDIWILRHGNNSFYNSGTIRLDRRMSGGLQALAFYTYSKTVADNWSTGDYSKMANFYRYLGRGEAQFSHPHRFVAALTYELPWGKGFSPLLRQVAAGWKISSITTFESGDALTVNNTVTSARDYLPDMPNITGNSNLPGSERTSLRYFNTDAFSTPPEDVRGNAGTGIVRAPGINNWDMAMFKTFHVSERFRLDFRAEMFNAFNHTQWGGWAQSDSPSGIGTDYSTDPTSNFGKVLGAREARVTQFSLKFAF